MEQENFRITLGYLNGDMHIPNNKNIIFLLDSRKRKFKTSKNNRWNFSIELILWTWGCFLGKCTVCSFPLTWKVALPLLQCSDQTLNNLISVLQCHPWISNADTHSTWRIYNRVAITHLLHRMSQKRTYYNKYGLRPSNNDNSGRLGR